MLFYLAYTYTGVQALSNLQVCYESQILVRAVFHVTCNCKGIDIVFILTVGEYKPCQYRLTQGFCSGYTILSQVKIDFLQIKLISSLPLSPDSP